MHHGGCACSGACLSRASAATSCQQGQAFPRPCDSELGGCTELSLRYNNIEESGAVAIGEALKDKWMDLGINSIGVSGAAAIAKALQSNTRTLGYMSLASSNIGDSGAARNV